MVNKCLFAIFLIFIADHAHAVERKAVDFHLHNWDGMTVTLDTLKNKVVVLTFSYSYCSVSCPIITGRLSSLDKVMNTPHNVVYLHISVDPDMDTPERRLKYFTLYGIDAAKDGRWMFVSGKKDELSKTWKFYGIEINKVENKNLPEKYFMKYTPKVLVIDKVGFIKHETGFFFSEDGIAKRIKELIRG